MLSRGRGRKPQASADGCRTRARDTFEDFDAHAVRRDHRHLDHADLQRRAQLQQLVTFEEPSDTPSFLPATYAVPRSAATDDVFERDQTQQPIQRHAGVVTERRTQHAHGVGYVDVTVRHAGGLWIDVHGHVSW